MSVFDKVIAAVTPTESEDARREARLKARNSAAPGDWLQLVLDQHVQIESAFEAVRRAISAQERLAAQKALAVVLTGHANAEESVLYPALARVNEKGHATMAFSEQAEAKIQMGVLETLPPMSQDYLDQVERIRNDVRHHMYEEEAKWFMELKAKLPAAQQAALTVRFLEEYERYVGSLDGLLLEEDEDLEGNAPLVGAGRGAQDGAHLR